ncbi:hypothetical protein [Streptococcus ruminantium]|uniref:hypothetical protein n=1 Tax=Streptococcus ruminantium TaxID=1917441 RepID=UPI0012DC32A7|nr:hypothetical protein [Streptococcus ruminantium]
MELAESTRLGVVSYLMIVMGVISSKATDMLKELETSGLVNVKAGGQLELKLLEDNHETY